ncbi:HEAT repeat-containing protein 6 [Cochliomyia hominivorax]
MENSLLTTEKIICQLRQNRKNRKDLEIVLLLENAEKHGFDNKIHQERILDDILKIIISANTHTNSDDAIIYGCVVWLTYLQEQQKLLCFNESQFSNLLNWLLDKMQRNEHNIDIVCRILIAIGNQFALHPTNADKYFILLIRTLLKYVSCKGSSIVILIATLQCVDKILSALKDVKLSEEQSSVCDDAGQKLLQLHFGDTKFNVEVSNVAVVVLSTLQILQKVVVLNSNFAKRHIAEILGLSKAYFHFGVDGNESSLLRPQKVFISQQVLLDSADEIETVINSENSRSCGGKTPKTRKPRAVVKNNRSSDYKSINLNPDNRNTTLVCDIKISDSDVSEPENSSNRILYERSKKAKIRLASISLVGTITRIIERKTIFGYWHAFFPNGSGDDIDNLLYIGQHDPNLRCRSAALQVCAHLIYGSRGFLHQAEINVKRCPTTFIPFSVSLGYMVLAIYKSLSTILSSESSLPVLTQALKCLAVLVQASPFQQFPKGFVQNFVKDVKPLVYHRDAAIQVSALMVLEFLVAMPEITDDIAEAVGLPPDATTKKGTKVQHVSNDEIDIVEFEEYVESDEEICEDANCATTTKTNNIKRNSNNTSWLLRRVLYNLIKQEKLLATSVRIESLQVLTVMSSHFVMIKPLLESISHVLQHSLNDALPDVRLYAARCTDACSYQISRYLLNNAPCSEIDIRDCNKFWLNMMPIIVSHIGRDLEEVSTVRITFCDALSNIGVTMFEHVPHTTQISLLSFLSGVSSDASEETIVRAAAVRALAVFALYPSLRSDLVFIENTAELTLRLVKDSNLLVRVKSLWSLGNISDALIVKETEVSHLRHERISDDLLYRLLTAATSACNDNDKVRCNAVRSLGNLLRLMTEEHFNCVNKLNWRQSFANSISKLTDCLRASGNAKVKWNTCYAISNLMRNRTIFKVSDLNWRDTLFPALCHVIIHHSNFKVRINASTAITNITERSHFGIYYEKFLSAVLDAVEQSYNLDNFHEYNHRDSLQEQLCLALCHIISLANNDDFSMMKKHLLSHEEIIRSTWNRVIHRMVPEKAAPLLSCTFTLIERGKLENSLSVEQKNCIDYIKNVLCTD